jgi:putative FmdB family regulatory protein
VLSVAEGGNVPTYQYACTDCGDESEVVQRFTDDPLTVCSACGGRLRKVFSPVGIVFKGSGFYRTDSRNGSGPAKAGKDSATGANGSASSSEKSEKSEKSSGESGSKTPAASSTGGDKKASSSASTTAG